MSFVDQFDSISDRLGSPLTNNSHETFSLQPFFSFPFFLFSSALICSLNAIVLYLTMRRSKSDPSKYARNYKAISQRHMTQFDDVDEEKEMESLRAILKNSQDHLKQAQEPPTSSSASSNKRKSSDAATDNPKPVKNSLISEELQSETGHFDSSNPLIVLPKKKKVKQEKLVQLSPQEIHQAKALQKNTARKLQQLETRAAQKKNRADLYKKLEAHQLSPDAVPLMSSSGTLARKAVGTKKQILQKLLKKERAGITLTAQEEDVLYPERTIQEEPMPETKPNNTNAPARVEEAESASSKKQKKKSLKESEHKMKDNLVNKMAADSKVNVEPVWEDIAENSEDAALDDSEKTVDLKPQAQPNPPTSGFDFAAQMMASLSTLKQETAEKRLKEEANAELENMDEEVQSVEPRKRYIPTEPIVLKTAAALGIQSTKIDSNQKIMEITRPEEVQKTRFDLPVSVMEFEIVDAIRNNDVTILCGSTGSGKSTQIPQFLYESGFTVCPSDPNKSFLIGITQPRRVAAVSTAKRVCYEMGKGDGQIIKSSGKQGNLVSYQTRYETAGVGDQTRVKFMTDGILLKEIQSDLLLRKYSVIVLDESHERNLNTDVLIGLLSVALPLRQKASEEDPSSIVPLKLILMSATLRVEDFTKNGRLFPSGPPAVVRVPGRTFPVTIHHSKVTELDDYGELYQSYCICLAFCAMDLSREMVGFFLTFSNFPPPLQSPLHIAKSQRCIVNYRTAESSCSLRESRKSFEW
jgi:ATP-dependent RNA helicase DHX37/DHR1